MLLNIEGLSFDDAWPVIQKLMALEHKALRNRYRELHPVSLGKADSPINNVVAYR